MGRAVHLGNERCPPETDRRNTQLPHVGRAVQSRGCSPGTNSSGIDPPSAAYRACRPRSIAAACRSPATLRPRKLGHMPNPITATISGKITMMRIAPRMSNENPDRIIVVIGTAPEP
jgi:hypothetical protein